MIGNVCNKVQVLLDRYNTFKKSTKQETVLKESKSTHNSHASLFYFIASELITFDWDTFQSLLSLLLYLDAFLQVLHRSHHTVLSFFTTNRVLLLDLASGGMVPAESNLSAIDRLLLEMQSQDEQWQTSVLGVCIVDYHSHHSHHHDVLITRLSMRWIHCLLALCLLPCNLITQHSSLFSPV